jgi:hypothetical protein
MRALQDSLARRGLQGVVEENPKLWRGNYRVRLHAPPQWQTLRLSSLENYAAQVNQALASADAPYLLILGPTVMALDEDGEAELAAWLQDANVVMAGGQVLDAEQRILHAGLVLRPDGVPLSIYRQHPHDTPGYMAATANLRNVSAPHPACCAVDVAWLQAQGGLSETYNSPYALLAKALYARTAGLRIVYNPFARFQAEQWQWPEQWPQQAVFFTQWQPTLLRGDPYYSRHLSLNVADMGINLENYD